MNRRIYEVLIRVPVLSHFLQLKYCPTYKVCSAELEELFASGYFEKLKKISKKHPDRMIPVKKLNELVKQIK